VNDPRPSRITGVRPLWAVEGARLTILGDGFSLDPLPDIRIGGAPARSVSASAHALSVTVPSGLDGGRTSIRIDTAPGETAYVEVGAPLATGLHQVDNPAFDPDGNLYVTFSGARGQETPVSVFIVRRDGSREPFINGIPNPTSLAFDLEGRLHVSSRFDGTVYRIDAGGRPEVVASELGVACGIAFDREGTLFVGDRSGSILRVTSGRAETVAVLPPSVAAFHLAFGPDGDLFVTGPTLGTHDCVYRISPDGEVSILYDGFGRPQGLAFDEHGRLYVVDALAGRGGLYRFEHVPGRSQGLPAAAVGASPGQRDNQREPEQLVEAGGLVGLAFNTDGTLALASADTVYLLDAGVRGLLPFTPAGTPIA
jgi:sugar lactone lactonase YvrE